MEKLKIFGLGFFSDKYAEKAIKGGFGLLSINIILAIVVIFFGSVFAEFSAFYPRYDSAADFDRTVNNLFAPSDKDNEISLFIGEDKCVTASRGGGAYEKTMLVNTFLSGDDRAAYSSGGFNVVIDTRDAYLYDDFEAYCESNGGDGSTITYEEYLTLTEVAKKNYDFKIRYTPNEVDLSDEKTGERVDYLLNNAGSAEAIEKLNNELSTGEISDTAYKNDVWVLYVKSYYPDLSEYETTADAPLVRNYYYYNYTLKGENDYLFVFSDSIVGSFTAADGNVEEFYGFFVKFPYGRITDSKSFVKTAYSASVDLHIYVGLMNVMRFMPLYILMPLVAVLISYLIVYIGEREKARKFSEVLKIISSFILWSAIFAVAITAVLSFFIKREMIFTIVSVLYFVVIMIRSIIWFSADIAKRRKDEESGDNCRV